MKVLAINSSPRKEKGFTANILDPFLEGMKEAGAELEVFYTKDLTIKFCRSCYSCWTKKPGKCVQKDDMEILLPKLREAEIWVLASPIYCDGISASMKAIIDRMIPLLKPFVELREGHCRHPMREDVKPGKLVYVASAAWWHMDTFDPMLAYIEALCKNFDKEFAGALLRPHSVAMVPLRRQGALDDILIAAKNVGNQLINKGKMSPEDLKIISRELMPLDKYIIAFNQGWEGVGA